MIDLKVAMNRQIEEDPDYPDDFSSYLRPVFENEIQQQEESDFSFERICSITVAVKNLMDVYLHYNSYDETLVIFENGSSQYISISCTAPIRTLINSLGRPEGEPPSGTYLKTLSSTIRSLTPETL